MTEWQAAYLPTRLPHCWLLQSVLVCMWRGARSPLMPVWQGPLHGEEEAPRATAAMAAMASSPRGALMVIPRHPARATMTAPSPVPALYVTSGQCGVITAWGTMGTLEATTAILAASYL